MRAWPTAIAIRLDTGLNDLSDGEFLTASAGLGRTDLDRNRRRLELRRRGPGRAWLDRVLADDLHCMRGTTRRLGACTVPFRHPTRPNSPTRASNSWPCVRSCPWSCSHSTFARHGRGRYSTPSSWATARSAATAFHGARGAGTIALCGACGFSLRLMQAFKLTSSTRATASARLGPSVADMGLVWTSASNPASRSGRSRCSFRLGFHLEPIYCCAIFATVAAGNLALFGRAISSALARNVPAVRGRGQFRHSSSRRRFGLCLRLLHL